MSLLRLLTAGKSLVGVMETESRYRLTTQRLLPHFGPARNPFGASNSSTPVVADESADAVRDEGRETPTNPPGRFTGRIDPVRASSAGHCVVVWRRVTACLRDWAANAGRRLRRPHNQAPKPAVSKLSKQPVQGELSLDRIKVVRNDLSDADLEVVPARRPAVAAPTDRGLQTEFGSGEVSVFGGCVPERSVTTRM